MTDVAAPGTGRVILITGGAGGLGRAVCAAFRRQGARIALADHDAAGLAEAARDAAGAPGDPVLCLTSDVTVVAETAAMVAATLEAFGRLDVLVNCAGVWVEGPPDLATEADWDRCLGVNLKGTFFACRHAIPALERTGGCIVNVASDAGLMGNPGAAIYCASKGGVVLLTKALALDLAPRGIRVNAVCPCDIDTPMLAGQAAVYGNGDPAGYLAGLLARYPQGGRARFATAEEIAGCIVALSDPRLAPLTGAALAMDFGLTAGH